MHSRTLFRASAWSKRSIKPNTRSAALASATTTSPMSVFGFMTCGPDSGQSSLETTLRQTRFVFEVIAIENVEDEFDLRTWSVKTRQGRRSFQTKLDEWPRTLETGAVMIRDLSGDLYQIKDPTAPDPASQKLVWAYI